MLRLASAITPTSNHPLSILDLCTGSGCIPILLCHLWPPGCAFSIGVDISENAIELATDNAARCNVAMHVDFITADNPRNVFIPILGDLCNPDLLDSLAPPFDVVTSNPPYIPKREYDKLPRSVKDYEDPRALLGDLSPFQDDGLSFYYLIARFLSRKGVLRDGAIVALEVGDKQAHMVENLLHRFAGLQNTETWIDPWGKERVVFART